MSLTDETSRELKALSFVCALMVVAIHCWSSRLFFEGEADLSSLNAGVLFFLTASLSRTAVPCFFVLTGFFLARGFQPGMSWYWTAIKKRFLSIFVPLLVWNVLNVALLFAFGKVGNMSASVIFQKIVGTNPYIGTACIQFWYLQTVIVWVLLSPITMPVLRRNIFAIPIIFLLIFSWILNYRCVPYAISPWAFLWLTVGTMAATHEKHIANIADRLRRSKVRLASLAVLVFAVSFRVFAGINRDASLFNLAEKFLVPIGVAVMFINADMIARLLAPFRTLWGLGFFVYAFHTFAVSAVAMACSRVLGDNELLVVLCKLIGAIAISLCTGFAFRKVFPMAFAVMTGGRR